MSGRHFVHAFTILLVAVAALVLCQDASAQRICEYPLFVKQAGTTPNVIILFDDSGSMNDIVTLPGYDPNTNYSGDFSRSRDYSVSADGNYTPRDFRWSWPSTPSAFLVTSDGGEDASYPGNYMNWLYYQATAAERALSAGHQTRIQGAKAAIDIVLQDVHNVRFGVWGFADNDDGGRLISALTTDKAQTSADIKPIVGDGYTPLAETLEDIYDALTTDYSMIQAYCQKTFIVIVTDGYPTKDTNVNARFFDADGDGNDPGSCGGNGCTDHLDDVAYYMFHNDLRPDLDGPDPGDDLQNATIYTIGYGLDAGFLQETADNGGGTYSSANNPVELSKSLAAALLDISQKVSSGTSATVVSAENATSSHVFRARFTPGTWEGELEAFDAPYQQGATAAWKAGELLAARDPDSRNIYTSTSGTNLLTFALSQQSQIEPLLNVGTSTEASNVIRWVRGEAITGLRDRSGWKLGDIVDSSPAPVGPPASFYDFLDYNQFRLDNQSRDGMLYVGSNSGMIHAFVQSTGEEAWSFIPKNQLPNLSAQVNPFYCHQFYVNLTPAVFDAYVNGAWKTVLMVGQREGGNAYTALDVTDPRPGQISVLWDKEFPDVVESWAVPTLIRDKSLDKYVVAVGSGFDETGAAAMLVLDVADGTILHKEPLLPTGSGANAVTQTVAFDKDFDGYDDLGYTCDLAGNVWRFDMSTFPWTMTQLFTTGGQPIEARPVITLDDLGQVLVLFGTGKYMEDADIADTSLQTLYCVEDDHSLNLADRSMLKDQTSTIQTIDPLDRGWYIDLTNSGERVSKPAALAAGTVYWVSFRPNNVSCQAGGQSWFWEVDFADGTNPDEDDGTEDDDLTERRTDLGEGIYSEPTIDLTNEDVLVQSTKTTIETRDTKGQILRIIVRSWREQFN